MARPRDADQVAAAVRYATAHDLALSVRSGGHGPLGYATNDGGMVLDLAHLNSVELVDPGRRVVRVGGGAKWGQVASVLSAHGLGLTAGDTTSVGVGGLTLGGGIGWMVRKHGLAIDNLSSARVVTADGRAHMASSDENPELFWAIRGGGGNFGVVVSFDFAAQPVTTVQFGTVTYQADDPTRIIEGWRDHMRGAPDDLTSTLVLVPPLFGNPASAMVTLCYAGDDDRAAGDAIEPLLALGPVTGNSISERSYADTLEDAHHPPGIRVVGRNTLVPTLDDDVIGRVVAAYQSDLPTAVSLRSLGGAFARVATDATAFAHRATEAMIVCGAFVPVGATDADVDQALAPWRTVASRGTGVYVNFQGSATAADLAAAYPPATHHRLAVVKRAYDPDNVFDRNHNVLPSDVRLTEGPAA